MYIVGGVKMEYEIKSSRKLKDDEIREILDSIRIKKEKHNIKNQCNMIKVIEKYFPNFIEEGLFLEDILYKILKEKIN